MRHYLILASLLALSACGTRGNLTLPPGPAPAPILGNPAADKAKQKPDAPAAQPAGAGDLNTATNRAK